MIKPLFSACAWLVASAVSLGTAEAHHSFATHYDATKSTQLTGVVTRFDFRSPHAFIFMNVSNEGGGIGGLAVRSVQHSARARVRSSRAARR